MTAKKQATRKKDKPLPPEEKLNLLTMFFNVLRHGNNQEQRAISFAITAIHAKVSERTIDTLAVNISNKIDRKLKEKKVRN